MQYQGQDIQLVLTQALSSLPQISFYFHSCPANPADLLDLCSIILSGCVISSAGARLLLGEEQQGFLAKGLKGQIEFLWWIQ